MPSQNQVTLYTSTTIKLTEKFDLPCSTSGNYSTTGTLLNSTTNQHIDTPYLQLHSQNNSCTSLPISHAISISSNIARDVKPPTPKQHTSDQSQHPSPLHHLPESNDLATDHPIVTLLLHNVLGMKTDTINYLSSPVPFLTFNVFKHTRLSVVDNWLDKKVINSSDHDAIITMKKFLALTPITDNKLISMTSQNWYNDVDHDLIRQQYLNHPQHLHPKQHKPNKYKVHFCSKYHIATSVQMQSPSDIMFQN